MRVAHFGTFDVDNYGDLLFPHVAEWRLPDWSVVHVSPTGVATSFTDNRRSLGFEAADHEDFDYYLVGGGNIVNARPTTLAPYRDVARLAYAGLWLGAAERASESGRPFAFNGPSISRSRPGNLERRLLKDAVSSAGYAAFRDEVSLGLVAGTNAVLVPDTAFDIARMWPYSAASATPPTGSIAVHVNLRYVETIESTAAVLDQIVARTNGPVRIVPIGPCHGDVAAGQALAATMRTGARLEPVTTIRAMANAIAGSELYIGSSMHGFITALAYGRRAMLVLNDTPMHKFLGVLRFAGLPQEAISPSWEALLQAERLGFGLSDTARTNIYELLDRHWSSVMSAARGPGAEVSRLVKSWRQVVPLAQVESLARRGAGKLARSIAAPRASGQAQR